MSKIQLKCDVCGGTFQDKYTKIICSYCERQEIELYASEKQKLIEKFLNEKKEELKIIQEIWYEDNDFDKEEKFDTIIGYLDNQYKKWEQQKNG